VTPTAAVGYGVLEEHSGGLVCHECGRTFPSFGLHAYRGHGHDCSRGTGSGTAFGEQPD
jgi:hypothetical protein